MPPHLSTLSHAGSGNIIQVPVFLPSQCRELNRSANSSNIPTRRHIDVDRRLPDAPPERTPITINAPSAKAKNGEYPIVKIKKRGYAWHPVRKEWRIANLVEHEHMIYDDEEMDAPELEPEEEGVIDSNDYMWAELASEQIKESERARRRRAQHGPEPETPCRFCHKFLCRKDAADRHEKRCSFPGGPLHRCDSGCPRHCVGPKPWTRAPGKPLGRKRARN